MKYIKYLIIALTGIFAAACAGDEPYEVGKLEIKASVSAVTATSVTINIDLRDCAELFTDEVMDYGHQNYHITNCFVTILEYSDNLTNSFEILSHEHPNTLNLTGSVTFTGLQPSTTYTYCVRIPSAIGCVAYRSADFTFTTAPEGDYSSLNGIKLYEVLLGDKFAVINYETIFNEYKTSITISENPDMSNPLEISPDNLFFGYQGAVIYDFPYSSENSIVFKGLKPNTKYYWTLAGDVTYNGTMLNNFKSEVYSFTTRNEPIEIFNDIIKSIEIKDFCNRCWVDVTFPTAELEGDLHLIREFIDSSSWLEADNKDLEFSHEYSYYISIKEYTGTINGHSFSINDFNYIPSESILNTPKTTANSETSPATVSRSIDYFNTFREKKSDIWIKGYIVGCNTGSTIESASFTAENAADSNILIADSPTEKDVLKCIHVQLPSGTDIRGALSLSSHPDNLGRAVLLRGDLESYFASTGLKNPVSYQILD